MGELGDEVLEGVEHREEAQVMDELKEVKVREPKYCPEPRTHKVHNPKVNNIRNAPYNPFTKLEDEELKDGKEANDYSIHLGLTDTCELSEVRQDYGGMNLSKLILPNLEPLIIIPGVIFVVYMLGGLDFFF